MISIFDFAFLDDISYLDIFQYFIEISSGAPSDYAWIHRS